MVKPKSVPPTTEPTSTLDAYIEAHTDGSAESNAKLYYLHARLLRRATRRIPKSLQKTIDPEQAVQDVWLKLAKKGNTPPVGPEKGELTKWMCKVLDQHVTDLIRRQMAAKRGGGNRQVSIHPSDSQTSPVAVLARTPTPSEDASAKELIALAKKRLPAQQYDVWYGVHVRSETPAELAIQMGRTPSAIRGLLKRAHEKLAECIQ